MAWYIREDDFLNRHRYLSHRDLDFLANLTGGMAGDYKNIWTNDVDSAMEFSSKQEAEDFIKGCKIKGWASSR
ncbi:MAG: hypothetical protein FWG66_04735 [Spirochaetes bacterium]|nr:hypothetical protein [Spirochaetota bacterium]